MAIASWGLWAITWMAASRRRSCGSSGLQSNNSSGKHLLRDLNCFESYQADGIGVQGSRLGIQNRSCLLKVACRAGAIALPIPQHARASRAPSDRPAVSRRRRLSSGAASGAARLKLNLRGALQSHDVIRRDVQGLLKAASASPGIAPAGERHAVQGPQMRIVWEFLQSGCGSIEPP